MNKKRIFLRDHGVVTVHEEFETQKMFIKNGLTKYYLKIVDRNLNYELEVNEVLDNEKNTLKNIIMKLKEKIYELEIKL